MHRAKAFLGRRERRVLSEREPTVRNAMAVVVALTAAVTVGSALLMRVVDRHDFPTIGSALWWAAQTVTTVGYGDITPTTVGGRIVAVVVMLQGLAFLGTATAAVTSTFIARAQRRARRTDEEQAAIRSELVALEAHLTRIEASLHRHPHRPPDDEAAGDEIAPSRAGRR